jgi:hypothetical protein
MIYSVNIFCWYFAKAKINRKGTSEEWQKKRELYAICAFSLKNPKITKVAKGDGEELTYCAPDANSKQLDDDQAKCKQVFSLLFCSLHQAAFANYFKDTQGPFKSTKPYVIECRVRERERMKGTKKKGAELGSDHATRQPMMLLH